MVAALSGATGTSAKAAPLPVELTVPGTPEVQLRIEVEGQRASGYPIRSEWLEDTATSQASSMALLPVRIRDDALPFGFRFGAILGWLVGLATGRPSSCGQEGPTGVETSVSERSVVSLLDRTETRPRHSAGPRTRDGQPLWESERHSL